MTGILEEIGKKILFFDGGTGSLLQEQGLKPGELPETWNVLHPEVIVKLHRDYMEAGADIICTNTFGANGLKYHEGAPFSLEEVVTSALSNAKQAVREVEEAERSQETMSSPESRGKREVQGKRHYIALDLGPTGKLLQPLGELAFEEAYSLYGEVVRIGVREGADFILIETMSDGYEAKAAVLAAKENSSLPVFVTMAFDDRGKLMTGGTVESTVALLEGLGVDALGFNCGLGPIQMKELLPELMAVTSTPVIVNPNAGLPKSENGRAVYDIDASAFADAMKEIVEMGACMVGGCCGTTPQHIARTAALCRELPPFLPPKKRRTVVTSYSHAVVVDAAPVIIGERINPTGKSKFKQALKEHDLEYILKEGVTQQEHGAHVLDVNVGLPGIDEPSMMEEVVKELQTVVDLPLQIDTSNPEAMERALRIYHGKPLVNSVNGKKEVMDEIFPLVKKYGGVVVALALDEDGIPQTAAGRVQVAKKIYDTAASYGIGPEDILIDGLCMTVSSDSRGALTTLETLRLVREELGGRTILGVSNISFGLPQREHVNAVFFSLAMHSGLNAAIINPNSEAMMRAYYSYRALADLDPQCGDYIAVYGGQKGSPAGTAPAQPASGGEADRSLAGRNTGGGAVGAGGDFSLSESVERGLKERARTAALELLETQNALDVINEVMIPALDRVGQGFEKGTVFLPQLLMSAEAAKAAFEVIKEKLSQSGQAREKKAKVILATVKGDIHDIGKNIVKVLLENYSYDVIDMGKDVAPELIVETAVREQVPIVGLSALMTTTVPNMEETIRRLRGEAPWVKVMVGGAVLTEEYAMSIGADRYCRDAMASVSYAESLAGGK